MLRTFLKLVDFKMAPACFICSSKVLSLQLLLADEALDLLQMMGDVIQKCPIDTRRALYSNIVLSVSLHWDFRHCSLAF